ncbi:TMEM175 family protein [Microbacterium sp. P05]|uniref:TMEM175 family protein n=1 Tax=Microbacterium sp. P05 TaxID=3366948 RepID=UPI0037469F9B
MTSARDVRDAERGAERLAYFTDAVCAFALTLVILPLVDTARELSGATAASFFADNGAALVAAAISFVVISLFWSNHHRLFTRVISWNRTIVNVNLLWLAGICFLPLATVIEVGASPQDALAKGIYVGAILATMITGRVEELLLVRMGGIEPQHVRSRVDQSLTWTPVALVAVALVVSVTVPAIGLWSMLLAAFARPIGALVRRYAAHRSEAGT